ncbi:MAG: hypothetical protein ABIH23_08250 [bacterium]
MPVRRCCRKPYCSALSRNRAFNEISERLFNATLADDVITPATGAEALLYVIRDGLEAGETRMARLQSGQYTQEDLRHRAV